MALSVSAKLAALATSLANSAAAPTNGDDGGYRIIGGDHSLICHADTNAQKQRASSQGAAAAAAPRRRKGVSLLEVLDKYFLPQECGDQQQPYLQSFHGQRSSAAAHGPGSPHEHIPHLPERDSGAGHASVGRTHAAGPTLRSSAALPLAAESAVPERGNSAEGAGRLSRGVARTATVPAATPQPAAMPSRVTSVGIGVPRDEEHAGEADEGSAAATDDFEAAAAADEADETDMSQASPSFEPERALDQEVDNAAIAEVVRGVKTVTVYRNACDPALFASLLSELWEPIAASSSSSSSHPSRSQSGIDVSGDANVHDDDGAGRGERVRVPSFPLGGGITEGQHRAFLQRWRHREARSNATDESVNSNNGHVLGSEEGIDDATFEEAELFVSATPCQPDARSRQHQRRLQSGVGACENEAPPGVICSFPLEVYYEPGHTGFEKEKEYTIVPGAVIAGRYRILDVLGQATFSRAVRCEDLMRPLPSAAGGDDDGENGCGGFEMVCLKIINKSKEFFDQALDEVKILTMLLKGVGRGRCPSLTANTSVSGEAFGDFACDTTEPVVEDEDAENDDLAEKYRFIRLLDYFYFKEHIILVCELLSDNVYEFSKWNRDNADTEAPYWTLEHVQSVARQMCETLAYVHSFGLMHCDLKPENVMFRSHSRCEIKVIDFGSSAFTVDHLSSYIQSRPYRAPEVVLGADYDCRIDIWSLGAILAELLTGEQLFDSDSVPEMLARISATLGARFPTASLLHAGRHSSAFVTRHGAFYERGSCDDGVDEEGDEIVADEWITFHFPVPVAPRPRAASTAPPLTTLLRRSLQAAAPDRYTPDLVDFIERCLTLDFRQRPTARQLLRHPFLSSAAPPAAR